MLQQFQCRPGNVHVSQLLTCTFLALLCAILTYSTADAQLVHTYSNSTPMVNDHAYGMEPTPDGGFILAGTSSLTGGPGAVAIPYVVKTDQNGNEVWSRHYTRITPADDSSGFRDIDLTYDGQGMHDGYVVTGFIRQIGGARDLDIMVMRLDLSGGIIWSRFF